MGGGRGEGRSTGFLEREEILKVFFGGKALNGPKKLHRSSRKKIPFWGSSMIRRPSVGLRRTGGLLQVFYGQKMFYRP